MCAMMATDIEGIYRGLQIIRRYDNYAQISCSFDGILVYLRPHIWLKLNCTQRKGLKLKDRKSLEKLGWEIRCDQIGEFFYYL